MGALFSYARMEGYPTMFGENKTPVTVDVLETGLIFSFVILAFSFLCIVPGIRGKSRLYVYIRVIVSLILGAAIMVGNFGQEWDVGKVSAPTPYKPGSPHEINATLGVYLGLRSVNITLKSTVDANSSLSGEIINYNERFTWTWDQGRFGFGPFAGRLQQEFREGQIKGLPIPILWIADYFTWDGEGLRFGRHYRTAGWYAHIAMWAALPSWMLANIMYLYIIRYGAYYTLLTGSLQLLACILWTTIRNPEPLRILIGNEEMNIKYGSSFWLTLITGVTCIIIGILIITLDLRFPNELATFFGTDPLADYDEYHLTSSELGILRQKKNHMNDMNMMLLNNEGGSDLPEMEETQMVLKRRATVHKAQKRLIRAPMPLPKHADDEMPLYLNIPPHP